MAIVPVLPTGTVTGTVRALYGHCTGTVRALQGVSRCMQMRPDVPGGAESRPDAPWRPDAPGVAQMRPDVRPETARCARMNRYARTCACMHAFVPRCARMRPDAPRCAQMYPDAPADQRDSSPSGVAPGAARAFSLNFSRHRPFMKKRLGHHTGNQQETNRKPTGNQQETIPP